MNRVDEFELRVADWLEEGPVGAPERAIEAAVEHARAHPRRALSRAALRRRVMSQLKVTQVAPRAPHTGWMIAAAAAVVVVVVGGAAIGTDMFGLWKQGQGVPVTPTVAPTSTGQPTPRPSPVALTGTVSQLSIAESGTPETTDGYRTWHGRVMRYTTAMSDERLTGVLSETLEYRVFADGTSNFEGTGTLTNGGGTWAIEVNGYGTGPFSADEPQYLAAILGTGKAGYAGLVFDGWISLVPDGLTGRLTMSATVRALAPGDTTGVVAFIGTDTPDFRKVGDVNQLRDYRFRVSVTGSDLLYGNSGTMILNADELADGTGTWWGTLTLTPSSSRGWTAELTGGTDTASRQSLAGKLVGNGEAAGRVLDITLVSGRSLLAAQAVGFRGVPFNMIGIASK
jgi:hypothetical protein